MAVNDKINIDSPIPNSISEWKNDWNIKMKFALGLYKKPFEEFINHIKKDPRRCAICDLNYNITYMAAFECHCHMHFDCMMSHVNENIHCKCGSPIGEVAYVVKIGLSPVCVFNPNQSYEEWLNIKKLKGDRKLEQDQEETTGRSDVSSNKEIGKGKECKNREEKCNLSSDEMVGDMPKNLISQQGNQLDVRDVGNKPKKSQEAEATLDDSADDGTTLDSEKEKDEAPFDLLEYELMTGNAKNCFTLYGSESPYFKIEWTSFVLKKLLDTKMVWPPDLSTAFSICMANLLTEERNIVVDLTLGHGGFFDFQPFLGDATKVTRVISICNCEGHFAFIDVDKESMTIKTMHHGEEYDKKYFYKHAVTLVTCMGWGDKRNVKIYKKPHDQKAQTKKI